MFFQLVLGGVKPTGYLTHLKSICLMCLVYVIFLMRSYDSLGCPMMLYCVILILRFILMLSRCVISMCWFISIA